MKVGFDSNICTNFSANKMSKKQARYFKERLQNAKSVEIICHELTDRDSLNSAIAMQRYMDSLGVSSRIIISQELKKIGIKNPDFRYIEAEKIRPYTKPADTALCVDFSAKERLRPAVLKHIQRSKNLLCIDHHEGTNLFSQDYVILRKPLENADSVIETSSPCYVDSSAKSATSIIYRLFEALDEPIDSNQAYSLMFGFVDDSAKKGYVVCDGKSGTIIPTKKLIDDKNALDVFLELENKLDDEQIKRIAQAVDVMSNLSEDEKAFKDSLIARVQLSDNKKIAYVEISPDDKQWQDLGGDNSRTSAILNRFRQNVINNKFQRDDLKDVELAIVFYEAENKYRISAHSKNSTLLDFYNYIAETKIQNFTKNAGGHKDRGGGKIYCVDPNVCHKWVEDIISCADYYDNQPASLQK